MVGDSYTWYRDGEVIVGENSAILKREPDGAEYTVEVVVDGCANTSGPYTLVTSVEDAEKIDFTVYPNPVGNEETIRIRSKTRYTEYVIYDGQGRISDRGEFDLRGSSHASRADETIMQTRIKFPMIG